MNFASEFNSQFPFDAKTYNIPICMKKIKIFKIYIYLIKITIIFKQIMTENQKLL